MILIRNLRLLPGERFDVLPERCAKKLRISVKDIRDVRVVRRSLDARRAQDIHYTISAAVSVSGDENALIRRAKSEDVSLYREPVFPQWSAPQVEQRPLVVGFGPAGMFASLVLARAGARPIVIERGEEVSARQKKVEALRSHGILDPESNVQFGEGEPAPFPTGSSTPAPTILSFPSSSAPFMNTELRSRSSMTPSLTSAPTCSPVW